MIKGKQQIVETPMHSSHSDFSALAGFSTENLNPLDKQNLDIGQWC